MPRTVPTRLGRLGVRVQGEGPVAVLWHTMFVDSHSWDRVLPVLSRLRTVVAFDGPSFGESDPLRRGSTIDECAGAAVDALDELGFERFDWVGNGWGGQVGIMAAARHPDRVRSLAAISSPIHALRGTERRRAATLLPIVSVAGFIPPVRRVLLESVLNARTRSIDPDAVAVVDRALARADRRGLVQAVRSYVLRRPDLEAAALSVEAPTIFVAGDERSQWTPQQAAELAARMPDARARVLHGVRNIAPLEDPDAVAGIIREHWAATERR